MVCMSRETGSGSDPLAGFQRRNGWVLWSIGLFSMAVNALMLTGPLYMLQVYDRVLGSRSQETLLALSLLVVFLFLIMGVLDFVRGRIGARYGARLQAALDEPVFAAALARARRRGSEHGALQDLDAVQRLAAAPVFMALFDLPWTGLFLAAIFLFHPLLGGLALSGMVLLIGLAWINRAVCQAPVARAAALLQRADRMAADLQGAAEPIRALGMQGAVFRRWQRQRGLALDDAMRTADVLGGFSTATRTMRMLLQSAILGFGAFLVLEAELTAGAMIAASILLGRALAPIEMVVGQWGTLAEAAQAWRRLRALLASEPAAPARMALPRPQAGLVVSQLSVMPPGAAAPTLRGISFTVAPGQALGVIGPSGAGKSTLARAITGVWQPTHGQIRLVGVLLDQHDPDALGSAIGYLPQAVTLFEGTIAQNIARLDESPDSDRVIAAARAAAAHQMILDLPQGYDTPVTGLGTHLSGGQIQRIGLARALYGNPVLLVLDEPNSAFDTEGSLALNAAVRALKQAGCTVVIMAHRPAAIRECDRLLVLAGGAAMMCGPTQEVLQKTLDRSAHLATVVGGAA
ncbi:MAG: hypothetical protein RLZZ491_2528 [Pseudomonadota bacterium]